MRTGTRSSRLVVYVSAAGSGDSHVLRPDEGARSPQSAPPREWRTVQRLALGGAIMPMAFSPRHHRLYAFGLVGPTLQVLDTPQASPCHLPPPDGRHVWVSCLGADQLLCYRPLAFVWAAVDAPFVPRPKRPRHLAFHPNGRWLFVINELDGSVDGLTLGEGSAHPAR